jgi:hypothetical protein
MSSGAAGDRLTAVPDRRRTPWGTVLALAAVMAYADGFWLTSLQGALGAIERSQEPFASWLRGSTLVLPLFAAAALWGLSRAHRRFGPVLRGPRAVAAAALLIAGAGSVVGLGQVVASSAYDYHLQSSSIRTAEHLHAHVAPTGSPGTVPTDHGHGTAACTGTCAARRATLSVHLTGFAYATPVLLATNLVLVGWVVALRGGRLDASVVRPSASRWVWTGAAAERTIGA